MQPSSWFTPKRVERLGALLDVLPSRLEPVALVSAQKMVWDHVGGPVDEAQELLEAAIVIGLVDATPDGVGRSPSGTRTRQRLRDGDRAAAALALMRAGALADQARRLVECAILDVAADHFRCPLELRRGAPQLLAMLELEEEIFVGGEIVLSRRLYELVGAVWVFMEPAEQLPPWLDERRRVGHLGELFSWNRERGAAADPFRVSWVSRDDDSLGYDIEDLNAGPSRCIEVKGSRGTVVQFNMSSNEMKQARRLGARYEIQFWGELDLEADPAAQYASLILAGYPLVILDPVAEFDVGGWVFEVERWRIWKTA